MLTTAPLGASRYGVTLMIKDTVVSTQSYIHTNSSEIVAKYVSVKHIYRKVHTVQMYHTFQRAVSGCA